MKAFAGVAALLTLCVAGCRSGEVLLAALDYQRIDPPASTVSELPLDRCYWWTEDDGRLMIVAGLRRTAMLMPRLSLDFRILISLDGPPAGRARDYVLTRHQVQARLTAVGHQVRLTGHRGICAVYRPSDALLTCHLRAQVLRQVGQLLGGWGRPAPYLLLATLKARHDPVRGRQLAECFERPRAPSPSSQPAAVETEPELAPAQR